MRRTRDFPNRIEVPVSLPFDAEIRRPLSGEPRRVFLLLHGFAESGRRMMRGLASALPEDSVVIAPNGLFPVPSYTADRRLRVTYAWYLWDRAAEEYWFDTRFALEFLERGVRALGFEGLPVSVIGFSQGGYLAPFVACRLAGVDQVIVIGADFLHEELAHEAAVSGAVGFRIDGVHGSADDVCSMVQARESHGRLLAQGYAGEFRSIEGLGHEIDDRVRAEVRALVEDRAGVGLSG